MVFALVYLLTYKDVIRKRIRKRLIQALGTDKPIPSEYEIDEGGLVFRQLGQELRFSWANVKDSNITNESIEVIMQPAGIAIIPKKIFADASEAKEWIEFIEKHKGPTIA